MSTNAPLVSIVTPVFNEAEHLSECIESILAQTYSNWDYTIVDNQSTDRSLEIARSFAARDTRIRVVSNPHFLRAIPNHNAALREVSAESKYCKIVFGDDWLFPECLQRMVALAEQHPSIGIVGAYALDGERVAWSGLPYPSSLVGGREICRRHLLEQLYVFGTATSVLYRGDVVRALNPFYNEVNIHADTEACFTILKSHDFGFVHQILSYSRVRSQSLSAASNDLQTDFAGMLHLLVNHGADYLTAEEYEHSLRQHLSQYYAFLGKSVLLRRGQAFWDYHKKHLELTGMGFNRWRLCAATLASLCRTALAPVQTFAKVRSRKARAVATARSQANSEATTPVTDKVGSLG